MLKLLWFVFNPDWSFEFATGDITPITSKFTSFAKSLFGVSFLQILPEIIIGLMIIWVVIFAWNKFSWWHK